MSMIKNLLIATCMAGAMTMTAGAEQVAMQASTTKIQSIRSRVKSNINVKNMDCRVIESKQIAKSMTIQKVQIAKGITTKRLVGKNMVSNTISPFIAKSKISLKGETSEAMTLNESFEDWPGDDYGWLPEGWTKDSKAEVESEYITDWFINSNASGMYPAFDGYYAAGINYDTAYKDEWLITPVVDVPAYPNLYYKAYVYPIFLFDLSYVDWDTFEFTEKKVAANLQVLVRAEGDEEWTVVKDYYEDYKDYTLLELYDIYPSELSKEQIDLSAFVGKRIQIAFRYYGTDGNSMIIDAVSVSNPALEASYSWPLGTLFYGLNHDFSALTLSMPVEPVNVPLTWYNTTEDYTASFTWNYQNADSEEVTSNETDLTETYRPDYTDDFTSRNNCFAAPTLVATAEGAVPGEFTSYDYFQCGGKAEWSLNGTITQFGMSVFDTNTEGLDIAVVNNDMESSIPVFGYSPDVDQYWTDYTFQGDEGEGDGVKLTGILNYYFTQEAPIVISGAWVHAKGLIGDNAEFTLDIIPIDDNGEMTSTIATAKVKGSDLIMTEGGTKNYYVLPFTFEAPVVLSQMDCFSYVVRLSGFNDPENVEWFAPYQSVFDNADGYALGWIEKAITFNGETGSSISPIYNYTGGLQTFSIMLDAAYPWLDAENTEVEISGAAEAEIALGSYYDGSELTATLPDGSALPEWLSVTTEGRYGTAKAIFTAAGNEPASCTVKIAAPGVTKVFHVSYDGFSGVSGIAADDNAAVREAYDAMGRRVAIDTDAKGLYLLRHTNGRVEKIVR